MADIREEFKQEYLGYWDFKCSVHNSRGKHCPDKPIHYFELNGQHVSLCDCCYKNYLNGYYDKHSNRNIPKESCLYIKENSL